jgi:hypothetical protein
MPRASLAGILGTPPACVLAECGEPDPGQTRAIGMAANFVFVRF